MGTAGASRVRELGETRLPSAAIVVRDYYGKPFFECKFRWRGAQIKRRIGPAWLEPDSAGGWKPSKRRMLDGYFNEARAHIRAAELVAEYVRDSDDEARRRGRRQLRPATFRELSRDYLRWLDVEYGAKPSTMRDHRYLLAEPGTPHQRGTGLTPGHIVLALGDLPAGEISTQQVRELLTRLTSDGMSPRNVNKHRNLIAAIFAHGVKRGGGGSSSRITRSSGSRRDANLDPHRWSISRLKRLKRSRGRLKMACTARHRLTTSRSARAGRSAHATACRATRPLVSGSPTGPRQRRICVPRGHHWKSRTTSRTPKR